MASAALAATLTLTRPGGPRVGADRMALLAAIGELGSIRAAAGRQGLSYKAAWDAVAALNNLFHRPLVDAKPGGRAGGSAHLTVDGATLLAAYRRVARDLDDMAARLEADPAALSFWSLTMKTSARNMLAGMVTQVSPGAVNSEVTLRISDDVSLVAIITRESAIALGLQPGVAAVALIDASAVILTTEVDVKTSARNHLTGVVSRCEAGAVNSEITLDIGGGKSLVAMVTKESALALGLKSGVRAAALIKAPHVILAVE